MKNNTLIIAIVVGILAAGAGFFGGMKYQQSKQPAFFRQAGNGAGGNRMQFQRSGQGMMFRPVSGEIISADEKSITVKMEDGSSKIVILSENTEINKADEAGKEELKPGVKVAVFGSEGTDGTVTAQSIQLNPRQIRIGGPDSEKSPNQ